MISIKELRSISQLSHKDPTETWYSKNVGRRISIYITWLLLHTRITANQVSWVGLLLGIFGGILLGTGVKIIALIGLLCFHLNYIFDTVDGEIARYRKNKTIHGLFLEHTSAYLTLTALWVGFGAYCYSVNGGNVLWLVAGFVNSISFLKPVEHAAVQTLFSAIISSSNYKNIKSEDEDILEEEGEKITENKIIVTLFRLFFFNEKILHAITLSILLDILLKVHVAPLVVLIFYGASALVRIPLALWIITKDNWTEKMYLKIINKTKGIS
ncbi:TPA: hypothetical protein DCX15_01075 [bacterium]|nr:hypothetical protein [bacterium]